MNSAFILAWAFACSCDARCAGAESRFLQSLSIAYIAFLTRTSWPCSSPTLWTAPTPRMSSRHSGSPAQLFHWRGACARVCPRRARRRRCGCAKVGSPLWPPPSASTGVFVAGRDCAALYEERRALHKIGRLLATRLIFGGFKTSRFCWLLKISYFQGNHRN
jgi:hypothetical protein